jgi:Zn-finger nucleic acid-binding protein
MKCPKCGAAMETVDFEGIEVDRCTGCRGLFFDAREAEKLKARPGSEALDVGDAQVGRGHNQNGNVRCPRDTSPMVRMVDPRQPHIHLETCPVCFGMFFDAGEFSDWKSETLADVVRGWFARPRS